MKDDPPLTKEAYLHQLADMARIPSRVHSPKSIEAGVIAHALNDMAAMGPAPPEIKERGALRRWWDNLQVGTEHFKSWFKLGYHELTQALAALPDSNIRPMEEPGMFGNETMPHLTDGPSYEQSVQQAAQRAPRVGNDQSIGI